MRNHFKGTVSHAAYRSSEMRPENRLQNSKAEATGGLDKSNGSRGGGGEGVPLKWA